MQEHGEEYPSLWVTFASIAPKIGCNLVTLRDWFKRSQIDISKLTGVFTHERDPFKNLEPEVTASVDHRHGDQ